MNYYELLEVPKNATQKEIADAYKKLIKEHHPDRKYNIEEKKAAEEITKLLNEAKSILCNPQKRKEYDNPSSAQIFIDPMKKTEAEEMEEALRKAFKKGFG